MDYNKNEEITESLMPLMVQSIDEDYIPVPMERYKELIRKEVELDLIYGINRAESYRLSDIVETLFKIRKNGGTDNA